MLLLPGPGFLRSPGSGVVRCCCQGHGDRLLFMPPSNTQSSPSSPLSASHGAMDIHDVGRQRSFREVARRKNGQMAETALCRCLRCLCCWCCCPSLLHMSPSPSFGLPGPRANTCVYHQDLQHRLCTTPNLSVKQQNMMKHTETRASLFLRKHLQLEQSKTENA